MSHIPDESQIPEVLSPVREKLKCLESLLDSYQLTMEKFCEKEKQNFDEFKAKMKCKIEYPTPPGKEEIVSLFWKAASKIKFRKLGLNNKWTSEETIFFLILVYVFTVIKQKNYSEFLRAQWKDISNFTFQSEMQCVFKFYSLIASQITTAEWSENEKILLTNIIRKNLKKGDKVNWREIAQEFYQKTDSLVFRSPKLCRGIWMHHLDPSLKKSIWSLEEDLILIREYLHQPKKWVRISEKLMGRNPDTIKNRFNHICKNFNIEKDGPDPNSELKKLLEFCEKSLPNLSKRQKVAPVLEKASSALSESNSAKTCIFFPQCDHYHGNSEFSEVYPYGAPPNLNSLPYPNHYFQFRPFFGIEDGANDFFFPYKEL